MSKPRYEDYVFLNCPFDQDYDTIMKAVAFVVIHCGFVPRCAKEEDDSGEPRMQKIVRLIESCKYGIHDVSRTELDSTTGLPRFNMPLELGVFLGAKYYGPSPNNEKVCLILDRERYRFQKFISDISGQDIHSHDNKPKTCVIRVRDWLSLQSRRKSMPTGDHIWNKYLLYMSELPSLCRDICQTPDLMTYNDYARLTSKWLKKN